MCERVYSWLPVSKYLMALPFGTKSLIPIMEPAEVDFLYRVVPRRQRLPLLFHSTHQVIRPYLDDHQCVLQDEEYRGGEDHRQQGVAEDAREPLLDRKKKNTPRRHVAMGCLGIVRASASVTCAT